MVLVVLAAALPSRAQAGSTLTFTYDADGARIRKGVQGGSTTTYPLGDDYEVASGVVTKYVSMGRELVAVRTGGVTTWIHTDAQGSVRGVSDASGALTALLAYAPFGQRLAGAGAAISRSFAAQRQDETGLYYLHARYYDPILGRFPGPDPTTPAPASVALNRYAYAYDNPVDFTDSSGLAGERVAVTNGNHRVTFVLKSMADFEAGRASPLPPDTVVGDFEGHPVTAWKIYQDYKAGQLSSINADVDLSQVQAMGRDYRPSELRGQPGNEITLERGRTGATPFENLPTRSAPLSREPRGQVQDFVGVVPQPAGAAGGARSSVAAAPRARAVPRSVPRAARSAGAARMSAHAEVGVMGSLAVANAALDFYIITAPPPEEGKPLTARQRVAEMYRGSAEIDAYMNHVAFYGTDPYTGESVPWWKQLFMSIGAVGQAAPY
jgi:RHS repeat-associated protein